MDKPRLLDEWISAATENPILSLGKRTSIVAKIKYLLGLAVMALVASLIVWPLLYSVDQPLKLTFNALETKEAQPKKMVNPRFHGLDKFNRPFNIRADEATQQTEILVGLKNISGDRAVQNGQWIMLEASDGVANTENKTLHLTGKVRVYTSEGYEIDSTDVTADMDNGIATSNVPVQMQGPLGLLTGSGFVLDINAQKLNITGRVHLTIYPQEAQHP